MNTQVKYGVPCVAAVLALLTYAAQAGSITYDFTTDPAKDPNIQIVSDIPDETGAPNWLSTGGNPGGFLVLTYAGTYQTTHILFPDLDPGKVVTSFSFECDLRIGNGTAQPADGFSINFARANDPILTEWATEPGRGYAGDTRSGFTGGEDAPMPETGSSTGIAVCFDTWSGNPMPDGSDLVGIMVRVDNKTLPGPTNKRGFPMPTFNGACTNANSAQTGPRDTQFWNAAGDIYTPDAWDTLCWAKLKVDLDDSGKLTVVWKDKTLLNKYQTAYFPTPGRLVFGGRTGGSHEQTHIDNIRLTTVAVPAESQPPPVPPNFKAAETGARRVKLTWDASVDQPDPTARVAYQLEKDGTILPQVITDTAFEDSPLLPGTSHTYRVRATDLNQNKSDWASVTVTTAAEVDSPAFLLGEIYTGITGATAPDLYADAKFPNSPARAVYLNGLSFGEDTNFGETFGDNYGIRITGVLTPAETAQYNFFIRSDDGSQFFLNTSGAAIPNPATATPIAEEAGCCAAFQEPGDPRTTAAPISLQAGTQYGFCFVVKEATGGDWGQVAWRKAGDTTPAASLLPIRGSVLTGKSDAVAAIAKITTPPADTTVLANEKVTFSVTADTFSPYGVPPSYQWYRNGLPISGAYSATYVIPVATASDSGAKIKVMVAVPGASATSGEATLTVNTDTKPPTVVGTTGSDTFTDLTVAFDEPVKAPSAATAANYTLSGGVTVSAATQVDPFTVRLTTSKQAEETDYTLTVSNVQDNAGNAVAAGTKANYRSWGLVAKRVKMELYDNISGTPVQGLYDDAKFPNSPDRTVYRAGMTFGEETNFGDTYGENYGARLTAWLIPTVSGQYDFFTRSDDASQLFLSSNQTLPDPKTATPIAEETGCCNAFFEPGNAQTTATPISLTAGQKYGMVFIVKEATGGDWGQVAWRKVGDTAAASDLTPLSDVVWNYGPPAPAQAPSFDSVSLSAAGVRIEWSTPGAVLQSTDSLASPITWTDVPGAASPYTTAPTGKARFFNLRQ